MYSKKTTIVLTIILFYFIIAGLFVSFIFQKANSENQSSLVNSQQSVTPSNKLEELNDKPKTNKLNSIISISGVEDKSLMLQPSDYDVYSKELEIIVKEKDPKAALERLVADTYTVKVVQKNCHGLTHIIGRFALEKYSNNTAKAITYNLDICGGGYVHGIIEHYLEVTPNAAEQITTLCTNPEDGGCFHALGHGAMLVNNYDIDLSVQSCKKLSSNQLQLLCGEGLFMENFDSENTKDSNKPFLKPEDPFYPCSNYTSPYNDACYYYSGRYIFKQINDPVLALQKCDGAKGFIQSCIRGMSAGILRSDLNSPEKMENYCNSVKTSYKGSCLQGSVNYYVLMFGSAEKTKTDMCNKFQNSGDKNLCSNYANSSPFAK